MAGMAERWQVTWDKEWWGPHHHREWWEVAYHKEWWEFQQEWWEPKGCSKAWWEARQGWWLVSTKAWPAWVFRVPRAAWIWWDLDQWCHNLWVSFTRDVHLRHLCPTKPLVVFFFWGGGGIFISLSMFYCPEVFSGQFRQNFATVARPCWTLAVTSLEVGVQTKKCLGARSWSFCSVTLTLWDRMPNRLHNSPHSPPAIYREFDCTMQVNSDIKTAIEVFLDLTATLHLWFIFLNCLIQLTSTAFVTVDFSVTGVLLLTP